MKRILPPELLPTTLWDSENKILNIPPELSKVYETIIDRHDLRELANSRTKDDSPVGGLTQEETSKHFAQAFDGSVARTQLAFLDPNNDLAETSNTFISILVGNKLSLTDAPCGAGAAAFAILANIAELRRQDVLPRIPLNVVLVGAEISEPAREYAKEILDKLRPSLEAQAIFVDAEFIEWDVTCSLSNTDLIQCFTRKASEQDKRLLLVANFNGFLEREGKRKAAEKQLEELFRHMSNTKNSLAIWIEPQMKSASKALLPWLIKKIQDSWNRFVKKIGDDPASDSLSTNTKFRHPLKPDTTYNVRLVIVAADLIRTKK
ncbi:hypothetical protein ANRL3_02552 [Anaerolineae bacterium]|nr:hypothetical protein ANRL3_02552 [Anaerolineae bacterium]